MIRYTFRRVLLMIPIILGVAVLIFSIMYVTPGDPAAIILGADASASDLAAKRAELGLDQPYFVQLFSYLKSVFIDFDFGKSYIDNTSISEQLLLRMPRTLTVAGLCMLLSIFIGIPLGVTAAVNQNRLGDRISTLISLLGISVPNFWLGLLLILLFSVKLGVLPSSGVGGIEYYIMPAITAATNGIATVARQTRSSMLEVIRADYIKTAKAKGLSNFQIIYGHALPNALIPVITVLGSIFAHQMGGMVVVERVFSIPGVGLYVINAVSRRDYPVIRGTVILTSIAFAVVMLLVDLLYAAIDPRIKVQYSSKAKRKGKVKK